ncbi:Tat pathway signal protein [Pseudoflavonifractor sp. 524-17]|uniref:Tat pathway signal protein n=1 Tax=Pseudoflavonifractor sp. 524-17 TaxID=2304577 RepID=UPI00137A80BF|nr:Tat pathway signal protein [Pseudoflavonifractor sp. 524-17]NCE63820.1 Tat pathway signal protein [Pseudoflavonifractor sp. 524-17]
MAAVIFTVIPLLLGLALEYAVCRLTMSERGKYWRLVRLIRLVPPAAGAGLIAGVAAGRWEIWRNTEVSPLTQVLFVPGVPGFFFLLGLLLGWRLWKRQWSPRVIQP